MSKLIIYGEEARQKMKSGVDQIAKAVVTTLGPKGRNVAIEKPWGFPDSIHDGVSVAREVELKDPFENIGAQMVKEASSKTNDIAGDGTTTALLLAQSIVEEGLRNVTSGSNPMFLKKGIEKAVKFVTDYLEKLSIKLKTSKDIENVATISAADETIGKTVAQAIEKVGTDGTVTAEPSNGTELEVEFKDGLEFRSPWASHYFITNPTRMEAELSGEKEDIYVLVTDKKVTSPNEIIPFLEGFVQFGKNLCVIAGNLEGGALSILAGNHLRGIIRCVATRAPYSGLRQKDFLLDVAALTGARLISDEEGVKLENITQEDLGKAKKVISNKETTVVVADESDSVKARIVSIKEEISKEKNVNLRERLEDRLSKLIGGIAVISVGASTEVEMKEKVERVKDAIGATRAALEEGIVPGGGVALLRAARALKERINEATLAKGTIKEELLGMEIVERALYKPLWWIADNAGEKADHVVEKVAEAENPNVGYNVYNGQYEDMIEAGVIDPVKVTRHALMNAASVAIMVLTTEALICEEPEEKEDNSPIDPRKRRP